MDSLESARVVHSFFENGSLYFFEALVGCELLEVLMKKERKWHKYTELSTVGPKARTLFSLHSFIEVAGVVCFAVAIALEFGAVSSTASLDKITDDDLTFSRKQTMLALTKSGDAMLEAAKLEKETVALRNQLRTQENRAALLMEVSNRNRFAKIERFRGQKVEIAQCGRQDNEITMTVITLMTLLHLRGWNVAPNNPFVGCSTGLRVIVRHNASDPTLSAAKALGAVLKELGLMPPEQEPFTKLQEPKPLEFTDWNPSSADTVLVVVLIHP
jgi:hypothetical protein